MNQVVNRVRVNWYSLIPQAARLRQVRGRVVLIFTITATGDVTDLRVVSDSGTVSLDRAATAAITASNPFPRLPPDYDDDHIVLQFTFLYNMTD
jgi:TonB family protein